MWRTACALLILLAAVPLTADRQLPAYFEKNIGQAPPHVRFIGRAGAETFAVHDDVSIAFSNGVRMKLTGACSGGPAKTTPSPATTNYLIGSDRSKWVTNVPQYSRVEMEGVLEGIDLVLRNHEGDVEYDFIVKPGADPSAIRMHFDGATRVHVDRNGDLVVRGRTSEIRQRRPAVYQGARRIEGGFLVENGTVSFTIGSYDRAAELIIDPVLVSSVRWGNGTDWTQSIVTDAAGNLYMSGKYGPPPWMSLGSGGGTTDGYVAKFDPGFENIYTTFIGGSGEDYVESIAVDSAGRLYAAGYSRSTNFPVSGEAIQPSNAGVADAVVFALDATGAAFLYSTYLGGSQFDEASGIALDPARNAFVVGSTMSADFPASNANAGGVDAFVAKFDVWGNFTARTIGGSGGDAATAVAVDRQYVPHITGYTTSADFPSTSVGEQTTNAGSNDAFVATLNSNGSVRWATYWGGAADDKAFGIAVDAEGTVFVTGQTTSANFPSRGPVVVGAQGNIDAFVMKIWRGNRVSFSRRIGGTGNDVGYHVVTDGSGCAWVAGVTGSGATFETKAALRPPGGSLDAFVAKFSPAGETIYSMPWGGSAIDNWGLVARSGSRTILVGLTESADFPLFANTSQSDGSTFIVTMEDGPALTVPQGFKATAGAAAVTITWTAVPGASGYVIQKRKVGSADVLLTPINGTTFTDTIVVGNVAYLYRVATMEAAQSSGPFSAWDLATVFSTTDDPIVTGVTTIKALHLREIRRGVEAAQSLAELEPYTYANRHIDPGLAVKAIDVQQTQAAINEVRSRLDLPRQTFTTPVAGAVILAEDFEALRRAIR